jgi:hypothetical protein
MSATKLWLVIVSAVVTAAVVVVLALAVLANGRSQQSIDERNSFHSIDDCVQTTSNC